jgi:hypothetical protein
MSDATNMNQADLAEVGLTVVGCMVSFAAVGSALGITAALLEEKSLTEIEYCGFVGTAAGLLFGIFVSCAFGIAVAL